MIRAISCHYESPELNIRLPEDLIRSTVETRFDTVASAKLTDLNFAIFDHIVHTTWVATEDNGTELSVLFNKLRHENSLQRSLEDIGQGYDKMHGQTHFRAVNNHYAGAYYTYTS